MGLVVSHCLADCGLVSFSPSQVSPGQQMELVVNNDKISQDCTTHFQSYDLCSDKAS